MQLLATSEEMRQCDRAAIERYGVPGIVLMENAGRAFVDRLVGLGILPAGGKVGIVAGKGNNGGDGFVIARHLLNRGYHVDVFMLAPGETMKGDAQMQWKVLVAFSTERLHLTPLQGSGALPEGNAYDVLVDAMFGTGFAGSLDGEAARVAGWMNASGIPVVAVDIASGVDATNGAVEGTAVRAVATITMGRAKPGHFLGRGHECSGSVFVADIGAPAEVYPAAEGHIALVDKDDVSRWLPERSWNANKYSAGKVYIVAGSASFTGAPVLAAHAAMKAGAGAVVLGAPASIHPILAAKLTEVIIQPLEETPGGTIAPSAEVAMNERASWADTVIVGPGLGRDTATDAFIRRWCQSLVQPLVLDADGLNAFEGHADVLKNRVADTILTPHAGELSRLTGMKPEQIERNRVDAARDASSRFRSTVVLKGAPTATGWTDGTVVLNSTGNPAMATIGSGDVLTGVIAALRAQRMGPNEAASAGAFLHGSAGDHAAARLGTHSVQAGDILQSLPEAFKDVTTNTKEE